MSLRHIHRGGTYLQLADPEWDDPLSGHYAKVAGARWNPAGSFPTVYLNRDERTARANLLRLYQGLPYGPEDLETESAPVLVVTAVPDAGYTDIITQEGCEAAGLPATYPRDAAGNTVTHAVCQPIGQAAWDAGSPGIACRSAAPLAPSGGEELAYFDRAEPLESLEVRRFTEWY